MTAVLLSTAVFAQKNVPYTLTPVADIPTTPTRYQGRTGTCWCHGGIAFLESELIRRGKGQYDLSEMFLVRYNYDLRIFDNYLKHGMGNLGQGGHPHQVMKLISQYGIVPEAIYNGKNYENYRHDHKEMNNYVKLNGGSIAEEKVCSDQSRQLLASLLDNRLGKVPEEFEWEGKKYTPKEFADKIGLDDEYLGEILNFTSFTHHPFYHPFSLEVKDNWDGGQFMNVPLEEFEQIIDYALEHGYTVIWSGDTNDGFDHSHEMAINPRPEFFDDAMQFKARYPEIIVTQENRQHDFVTFRTLDQHVMLLTGICQDERGQRFYKAKESAFKDGGDDGGFMYMSRSFTMMRGLSIMVHKNGVPKEIRKKCGFK
ncbi:MAG: aminopeptidase [Bacteroidales bacterium]|nr:aminopeptidase [Bacteroidales bacterium]